MIEINERNEVDRIRSAAGVLPYRGLCVVCAELGNVFLDRGRWWCMKHLSRLYKALIKRGLR